ncbi:copper resistance protein CopC [Mesorhizobium sp. YIM 152430]|uniref:copper resistance CopC/CopD family protein n=1 Tax=Mesorhizobium sp. YIM 152430 TaxID=3031761 RepID=UPI0023DCCEF4|nr:copper resistance protein CopC [Mesorhizobium sp. YIM 152430]MDF1598619.1 copper resistance protein CopC [Mesorhizobium sp. YIM 152430]
MNSSMSGALLAMRIAAFGALVALMMAGEAAAHASLTGAEPADGSVGENAPSALRLDFNEPVSPLVLRIVRPDGEALDLEDFEVRDRTVEIGAPPGLGEGTHVLTWRVVSSDGHPVGGSVVFSIGAPSAAPPALGEPVDRTVSAANWLAKLGIYVGLFPGAGGAFALAWFVSRSRPAARPVLATILVGLMATAVSPGLQGLDALGAPMARLSDPMVWSAGLATSYGPTIKLMLAGLAATALSVLSAGPALSKFLAAAGLAAGAYALTLSGHASAAEPQWLTRPAVALHAAGIAVWVGALVPLGLALRADAPDAITGLKRFSMFIPFAVAALIAAGIVLAIIQVETPAALTGTAYGQLFLAKLGCLAALFALAAFNRWKLTRPVLAQDANARTKLVRSIAAETLVVLVIIAVAAGWRFTPPPRALAIAAAQPALVHIHTADGMADVAVTPGRAGAVSVSAVIMTGDFGPLDAKEVAFVFSSPSAGIEPFRREAQRHGDGSWRADGVILPLPGLWTVRLDILVTDFDIVRLSTQIEIRP